MKVGITGTREGMTDYQIGEVYVVLAELYFDCQSRNICPSFHHGDCKGVDVQAAEIARALAYTVVCHPPTASEHRGYAAYDEVRTAAGYLQRDRAIVDECDFLLVVPLQMTWQARGGTWYTHDYAKKTNKPFNIIWPEVQL